MPAVATAVLRKQIASGETEPLYALGVWDRARTFPNKGIDHWEHFIAQDHAGMIADNLRFAREHGAPARLVGMLERGLRRRRRRDAIVGLLNTPPLDRMRPAAVRLRALTDRLQRRRVKAVLERQAAALSSSGSGVPR